MPVMDKVSARAPEAVGAPRKRSMVIDHPYRARVVAAVDKVASTSNNCTVLTVEVFDDSSDFSLKKCRYTMTWIDSCDKPNFGTCAALGLGKEYSERSAALADPNIFVGRECFAILEQDGEFLAIKTLLSEQRAKALLAAPPASPEPAAAEDDLPF